MSKRRRIRADRDGLLPGVRVIGLHGHLHPTETPARSAPVLVDEQDCLLRVLEVRPVEEGFDVEIETAGPPIPASGDLPGHGTRVGPWPAIVGHHVVVVGPGEIERAERLEPRSVLGEPSRVARFVRWLLTGGDPGEISCQKVQNTAVWYCSKAESFALFERIHSVVQDELFDAMARLKAERPGARSHVEDVAFWLSRAATGDQDIYRAAAALRRCGSQDWRVMLREGLRLKNEEDWARGLADANALFDSAPAPERPLPAEGPKLAHGRATVRSRFQSLPVTKEDIEAA